MFEKKDGNWKIRTTIQYGDVTTPQKGKGHIPFECGLYYAGDDLLSHTLSRAVQSAQRGLTSVFGMGTGGSPAVRSPTSRSCQLSALSLLPRVTFRADGQQTCKRPQIPALATTEN